MPAQDAVSESTPDLQALSMAAEVSSQREPAAMEAVPVTRSNACLVRMKAGGIQSVASRTGGPRLELSRRS